MKRIVLSRISTLILGAGTLLCACTGNVGREVSRDNSDVEIDKTWCAKLMPPHGGGVTGGDGSISIDLTDGRSLFMWGDSFFGDVNNDETINAQDALNTLSAWLRKSDAPEGLDIVRMNVTGDSRINTYDALGIMEHYVNGSEFKVLSK